jgi:hypothetical protein
MLVVYTTREEGEYLGNFPKAQLCTVNSDFLRSFSHVILYGTCGALYPVPLDEFICDVEPFTKFVTVDAPLHDSKEALRIRAENPEAIAVEMELKWMREMCDQADATLGIVKFPIDYCEKKAKPVGINHFWRKYQMWRMERKFNRFIGFIKQISGIL